MRDVNALKRQPHQGVEAQPAAGDVPPNPAPASAINPLTPQPLDPSRTVTDKAPRATSGGQRKKPHPLLSPPVLVTAGLTVVLLELALWVAVGMLWWVAVNLLLVAVLLGSLRWLLAWWRRQVTPAQAPATGRATPTRGPLGRLSGSKSGGTSGSRSGGLLGRGRSGSGSGGGRLGRLFGGSGKSGGSRRSGGASGSGRRGGLGRLLSGGRRTGSGTARSGTGSGRSGLRGLLGGAGRRSSAGRSGGGLRSLLGGRKSTGGVGRSGGASGRTGAAGGSRRGGAASRMRSAGRGLLGRASGRPSSAKRPTPTGSPRRGSPARKGSTGLAAFFKGVREGATAARKPAPPPATRKPEAVRPDPKPAPKETPRQQAERKPSPQPRAVPKENRTMVQHQDDVSLQRWGRNLTTVSPAIEELAKGADSQGQLAGAVATAVGKLAAQGDDELPAAKTVTAEAAAIAAELKQIEAEQAAAAGRLRSLMGRADALGASYRRNHEVDEARLAGERGGRHRERRADVSQAEQDT